MSKLHKYGGIAALVEALIYISAFIFWGIFWDFPTDADSTQTFVFLAEKQFILSSANFIMYVLFGVFLLVLVLALHQRLKHQASALSQVAAAFGIIWVGLVIASGMIANIGLGAAIDLSSKDPHGAMTIWRTINVIVEGLGGGNEIVGGLWVLLLSVAALKGSTLSKSLSYFGLFIGFAGISTVYPADLFTEIFGLGQIVWFIWIGVYMLRGEHS